MGDDLFVKNASRRLIGDMMIRSFGFPKPNVLPLDKNTLEKMGWHMKNKECDLEHGFVWSAHPDGPRKDSPLTIHTSKAGQVAGIGLRLFNAATIEKNLVTKSYWMRTKDEKEYDIVIMFRGKGLCDSDDKTDKVLGDSLVINPKQIAERVPLTEKEATQSNYTRGSCWQTMGTHYAKDLSGQMSWTGDNMMPVMPFYDQKGDVHGILFATTQIQHSEKSSNWWDVYPLPPERWCVNFCDEKCYENNFDNYSTMHIYFNNPMKVQCPKEWACMKQDKLPIDVQCCPNGQFEEPTKPPPPPPAPTTTTTTPEGMRSSPITTSAANTRFFSSAIVSTIVAIAVRN